MIVITLWTLSALVGLIFALIARQNAIEELAHLGDITNGRRRLGKGHVRDETIIAIIDATWFLIGVGVIVGHLINGTTGTNSPLGLALVFTSVLLSYKTLARWQDRRYALHAPLRDPSVPETQNQREDRQMGDERRIIEQKHIDDK